MSQGRNRRTRPKAGQSKSSLPTTSSTTGSSSAGGSASPNPSSTRSTSTSSSGGGSRAAERLKERESERQRRRITTTVIVIVAAAAIFGILFILVNLPQEAPIPAESAARYEGLDLNRTQEGYPLLGELDAPVKVAEYSSFDCTHCRDFHAEVIDQLAQRVRENKIALIYVPIYGTGAIANGQGAALAAICAAEQRAFWQFHDMLFDWQGRFGNQSFTNNRINAGIDALGLDRGQMNACISSGGPATVLSTARTQSLALTGYNGTPTITINGVVPVDADQVPLTEAADIIAAIDREVERVGSGRAEATPEATSEIGAPESTAEATDEVEAVVTPAAEVTDEATPEATVEATTESGG